MKVESEPTIEPLAMSVEEFWNSRDMLAYIREYALAQRVGADGLLFAVITRFSAFVPCTVMARTSRHEFPMNLNMFTLLVSKPGAGKSKTMRAAESLVPLPDDAPRAYVGKPKTAAAIAGIMASRVSDTDKDGKNMPDAYRTEMQSDRVLLEFDEISTLNAANSRTQNAPLSVLLEAYTGGKLGGDAFGKEYSLTIPRDTYRLSALVGAQPGAMRDVFANEDVGYTARFLFGKVYNPDAPYSAPPFPDPDRWKVSLDIINDYIPTRAQFNTRIRNGGKSDPQGLGAREWPELIISMPECSHEYFNYYQVQANRGELSDSDSHRTEPVVRLTALLALMEGRTETNEQDFKLARYMVEELSNVTREQARKEWRESKRKRKGEQFADDAAAREQAEEQTRSERYAKLWERIISTFRKHDPKHEGLTRKRVQGLNGKYATEIFKDVWNDMLADGVLDEVGGGDEAPLYALAPDTSKRI